MSKLIQGLFRHTDVLVDAGLNCRDVRMKCLLTAGLRCRGAQPDRQVPRIQNGKIAILDRRVLRLRLPAYAEYISDISSAPSSANTAIFAQRKSAGPRFPNIPYCSFYA